MKNKERKAVILCGGKGTRLRPLTATTPKPQLEIGGVPVIINIIRMLKRQGICSIALTVGYKGREFERFVMSHKNELDGVELHFYYEDQPLGSAGGVKRAKDFLDCDFAVVCGDAWCDFDINSAFDTLERNNCSAVIVTAISNSPLEYGLIVSEGDGKIKSFSEKPSWSGVCSNTVNTGIYIFKKEILDIIPDGKYDFGRDLFAKMLSCGMEIYAHPIQGKWWDIGDPEAYYRCNMELTHGENQIGKNCFISPDARVNSSVILDDVIIEEGCVIIGAVIAKGCKIKRDCVIKQGCVIGEGSELGEGSVLRPGVFLPQMSVLKEGSSIYNPLHGVSLFMNRCMEFDLYMMTPVFCQALGKAIRRAVKDQGIIGIISDGSDICKRITELIMMGISNGEGKTYDYQNGNYHFSSFVSRSEGLDLGVYISSVLDNEGRGGIRLDFFDENGVYPGAAFESNVRYSAKWGNNYPCSAGITEKCRGMRELYLNALAKECDFPIAKTEISFEGRSDIYPYIQDVLKKYGFAEGGEKENSFTVYADACGNLDGVSYGGEFFDKDDMLCVGILSYIGRGIQEIPLPYRTAAAVKNFVKENGARLTMYSLCSYDLHENAVKTCFSKLPALIDPCFTLFSFISYVVANRLSAKDIKALLPKFVYKSEEEYIPKNLKQKILECGAHSGEGFMLSCREGIRLVPENSHIVSMCVEAADIGEAREMMEFARRYVKKLIDTEK